MKQVEYKNADEYLENTNDEDVLTKLLADLIEYNSAPSSKHKIDDGLWVEDTAQDVREDNMDLIEQMVDRWGRITEVLKNGNN